MEMARVVVVLSLITLPEETIILILAYLPTIILHNTRRVCTRLHYLTYKLAKLDSRLFFGHYLIKQVERVDDNFGMIIERQVIESSGFGAVREYYFARTINLHNLYRDIVYQCRSRGFHVIPLFASSIGNVYERIHRIYFHGTLADRFIVRIQKMEEEGKSSKIIGRLVGGKSPEAFDVELAFCEASDFHFVGPLAEKQGLVLICSLVKREKEL
jgi:hypothetical protein